MVNRATAKINEVDEVSNCTSYEADYDEWVWATKDGPTLKILGRFFANTHIGSNFFI